jgi:hypothetical protein
MKTMVCRKFQGIEHVHLYEPCHDGRDGHHKSNRHSHAKCGADSLGHSQEGAYAQELCEDYIVDKNRGYDD